MMNRWCEELKAEIGKLKLAEATGGQLDWEKAKKLAIAHHACVALRDDTFWDEYHGAVGKSANGHTQAHHHDVLTSNQAKMWVRDMKSSQGMFTPWTMEQTTAVGKSVGVDFGVVEEYVFFAVMNMLKSDYGKVLDALGAKAETYGKMALCFINDPDTVPVGEKLGIYYNLIAN